MAKTSGTIDLKSLKAASMEATNYVTDIDDNGVSVHPKGNTIDKITISNAIEFFKNSISYLKIWIDGTIAKIRIGKEDSPHFLIQDSKISGYGNANNIYFETGNAGNEVQQTYIGDGSKQYFEILSASELESVTVNDSVVSATLENSGLVKLSSIPADDAKIVITYITKESSAPYFTFGTRGNATDNGTVGIGSSSFGRGNISSGFYATAEGFECVSNGYASHAEGYQTETYGSHSHAEGEESVTWGAASHAEGRQNIAYAQASHAGGQGSEARGDYSFAHGLGAKTTNNSGNGAMACGQYNFTHNVLFGVGYGDGPSDNDRKNAFSVSSTGNCFVAGTLMSGTPSLTASDYRHMFYKKNYTFSNLSVPANDKISSTQIKSIEVAGYTPIAVSNYGVSGTNAIKCFPFAIGFGSNSSGNTIIFNLYNTGSSAATVEIRFTILYIATAAL